MACGNWGDHGLTPTFPNGFLRMFHGRINTINVTTSQSIQSIIRLAPATDGGSLLYVHHSGKMPPGQSIILEYRRKSGQASFLPVESISLYVVQLVDEPLPKLMDFIPEVAQCSLKVRTVLSPASGAGNPVFPNRPTKQLPTSVSSRLS
jgi:hypothetical protein